MHTTIQKWGNSQGIRIPKSILDSVQWNENEKVVLITAEDKIIIERAETRKNIKELFSDFQGVYTPTEISWGDPVGEEIW